MTAAGPWSVKGIDPKARELAKDLARRNGMTLGEWLNQMIIEGDDEDDPPPQPFRSASREVRLSSDGELKRVARALDVLTSRVEAAEHRSTLAISGIDQQVMGVLSRIEGVERDRNAVAARIEGDLDAVKVGQETVNERLRRLTDEDGPRLEAMRAFEAALGKIAEKVYDTEGRTRAILNEVREDVSNAARRIDRIDARLDGEPSQPLIEAVVARVGERLVEAESRTTQAMQRLEASFAGLDARLKSTEAAADENSPERRFERLAAELAEKVEASRAELTERLNAAADGKLDRMEATLRELAGHVEQGERRSAQAIDRMGREVMRIAQTLGDRVGSVEARSAEAAQQMGGDLARIAAAMEQRMSRADQAQAEALEKLGGEISKIAERLADRIAAAERRSAAAIDDVGEQVGRVSERLNERYEASQGALTERIRASEERTARLLEEARETIDRRLSETVRPVAVEPALEVDALEDDYTPTAVFADDPFNAPLGRPERIRPAFPDPPAHRPSAPEPDSAFTEAGFDAAVFAPEGEASRPFEPRSTRDVVAAARAAARAAAEAETPRIRGRANPDLRGSVPAPAPDADRSGFSFGIPARKKKEPAVSLRTMVVASGTAAALAVTAVGATMWMGAEGMTGSEHVDRSGPAPTAARKDEPKPIVQQDPAAAPAEGTGVSDPRPETLAVALNAGPDGPAAGLRAQTPEGRPSAPASNGAPSRVDPQSPPEARPLYNTAVGKLQAGDVSGVEDLRKAANLGFGPAQFYLAKLYEQGGSGVKKDLAEARRWTERAAQAGDPKAMHNLALYEFNGEGGAKDQSEAGRWFRKAAEQGVVDSQYNLARLYDNGGYGVPQNKAEAYKWYLIAAANGDADARSSATALRAQLPGDQAAAAERSARGFHALKAPVIETARAQ
jgi:localization factor PodJL